MRSNKTFPELGVLVGKHKAFGSTIIDFIYFNEKSVWNLLY